MRAWAAAFAEQNPIPRVSKIIARNALKDLEIVDDYFGMRMPPTAIDTVTDVWCSSAKCGRDMAMIYIVRTAEPA